MRDWGGCCRAESSGTHRPLAIPIAPYSDGRDYVELAVNAQNVVADRLVTDASSVATAEIAWNAAGLESAVKRHRAGWVVELAIPWPTLAATGATSAPKPGDQWRAALSRVKRVGHALGTHGLVSGPH